MNVLAAIGAILLFLLGIVLFGIHTEVWVFFGGILCVSASLFVAFSLLPTQRRH
ncbi:hypothetical protein SCB71_07980 [Herbiconiux sp. KACC 21604]|uniref:Major facilitator superfamily (MFS) profile domain-containing protein n=1 Tax=Herbiconiux sp. A18JL235 TaxID=3152363 RepID=A0AB39BCT3_9MICO|nr:hypothetical protein [Herbiconiux sp. SALV-R1]QJU53216.1 hypothetical protein HL652_05945 [Herbiconiux sp. SALV-R1]WPO88166.1 hypothetical protein SCB71_07980 [Herbiconiux sp. KACC 21604]